MWLRCFRWRQLLWNISDFFNILHESGGTWQTSEKQQACAETGDSLAEHKEKKWLCGK